MNRKILNSILIASSLTMTFLIFTATPNPISPALSLIDYEQLAFFDALEERLQTLTATLEGTIGIAYIDLETGQRISLNGDLPFLAASTQKLPTHLQIAEMVRDGLLTWDTLVTYDEATQFEPGTGRLQYEATDGDQFPVIELLELSITYSDNIAHTMLASLFAANRSQRYEAFFSRYLPDYSDWELGYLSPNQLATILEYLYRHQSEIPHYEMVFNFMSRTLFPERLLTPLTRNAIARTIGTNDPNFHDIGIFSHPNGSYILAVMTVDVGHPAAVDFMAELSDMVWEMQVR